MNKSKSLKPSWQLSLPMVIIIAHYLIIPQLPHYNEIFNVKHIKSIYIPIWMPTKSQTQTEKPRYWIRNLTKQQRTLSNIDSVCFLQWLQNYPKKKNHQNIQTKTKAKQKQIKTKIPLSKPYLIQMPQSKPYNQHNKK